MLEFFAVRCVDPFVRHRSDIPTLSAIAIRTHAIAAALLLTAAVPVQPANAQQVLDFNNVSSAGFTTLDLNSPDRVGFVPAPTYFGFNFAGFGFLASGANGHLVAFGDGVSLLMHSATPFTFVSALFESEVGVHNFICVRGYTLTDPLFQTGQGCGSSPTYSANIFAEPDEFTKMLFNWSDVTTIAFDGSGGVDPNDHCTAFRFFIDDITVTSAPEPGTLFLVAAGLFLVAAGSRARRSRHERRLRSVP